MSSADFEWLKGKTAAYRPTVLDPDNEPEPVQGMIEEVRDESPISSTQHIRVVLKTDEGLVDVGHDRVEVLN